MEAIRGGWACTSGAKPAGVLARPKPHQTESLFQSPKGAELHVGATKLDRSGTGASIVIAENETSK
jgi:hypothetical protein